MNTNTAEVLNRGMECLITNLGLIEAETFISVVIREKFDYTKWQREYFDRIPEKQLHEDITSYAASHPYTGKAREIIK